MTRRTLLLLVVICAFHFPFSVVGFAAGVGAGLGSTVELPMSNSCLELRLPVLLGIPASHP